MQTIERGEPRALIQQLDLVDQIHLIEELATMVRLRMTSGHRHSILELQGLGKEIWRGIDAQEYIDRERASWNG